MKAPLALLAFAALLALMLVVSGTGVHPIVAVATPTGGPNDPAEAAMAQTVLRSCGGCHGLSKLSQSPHDAVGWHAEIARMRQIGAQVPADQEDALANYLAAHFGSNN